MFFVMSLRLSDHKVLQNIASSSSFFRFRSDFLASFARISYFKFLEFKEFNKTIIPFALVGYETGYSQLGATHGIIVKYTIMAKPIKSLELHFPMIQFLRKIDKLRDNRSHCTYRIWISGGFPANTFTVCEAFDQRSVVFELTFTVNT